MHGAGRAMSRNAAAGRPRKRWVNDVRDDDTFYETATRRSPCRGDEGAVGAGPRGRRDRLRRASGADLRRKGIELRGGAADEAPGAYKRLTEVLAYHEGTVRILHTLTPLGVAMAGADTFDPYKD